MELAPGSVIDRYVITSVIGQGGMATVYKVRHSTLGSMHALKVLTISNPGLRERLRTEGEVQAKLRHPNILPVTDVIDAGGALGLVMELVEGPDLDALLAAQRLSYEQADVLAKDIIAAVGAAHAQGLIHRDLKPANILLQITDDRLVPKITDFGLAKVLSSEGAGRARTRTGAVMGTPHYMAPEQVRDAKHVGPQADVWALGTILYEMVTGRRAFDGDDLYEIFTAVAEGRFVPVRQLAPDLPDRMEAAISAALTLDPTARVQDCRGLLALWNGEVAADGSATPRRGPWSGDVLQRARAISAGGAASAGNASAAGQRSGATFAQGSQPPRPPARSVPRASGTSRSIAPPGALAIGVLVGGGGALLAGGALLVVLLVGGWFAWSRLSDDPTDPGNVVIVEPAPPDPAPVEVPAPGEPPAPAPGDPSPGTPTPGAPAPGNPAPGTPAEPAPRPPAPVPDAPVPVAPEPTRPAPVRPDPAPTGSVELPPDLDPNVARRADARETALLDVYRARPEATQIILKVLQSDPNGDVKNVAAGVLRTRWEKGMDAAAHQKAMVWCAKNANVTDARTICLRTLGERGDVSVGSVLMGALDSGGKDVQTAAASGCRQWVERHPDQAASADPRCTGGRRGH